MRRLIALLSVLLCAGCGPQAADGALTDSRIPPSLGVAFLPPQGWAWGLIQVGDTPPIRYGVAAPPTRPRGDILILCGYGETAEAWFEPARALIARGYAVWVVDGAAQGGSGRFTRPRDLGHAPDLASQVTALRAMTAVIGRPFVLVAQSTAAPTALLALASGLQARLAILSAPVIRAGQPPLEALAPGPVAEILRRLQLDRLRVAGRAGWGRPDPLPKGRAGVVVAWQIANPDLRMGGPSYGYLRAFAAQAAGLTPQALGAIALPVLSLRPESAPDEVCIRIRGCRAEAVAGGRGSLHLEGDSVYRAWLRAVEAAADRAFPGRARMLAPGAADASVQGRLGD